jgi:hypothetical protein
MPVRLPTDPTIAICPITVIHQHLAARGPRASNAAVQKPRGAPARGSERVFEPLKDSLGCVRFFRELHHCLEKQR